MNLVQDHTGDSKVNIENKQTRIVRKIGGKIGKDINPIIY